MLKASLRCEVWQWQESKLSVVTQISVLKQTECWAGPKTTACLVKLESYIKRRETRIVNRWRASQQMLNSLLLLLLSLLITTTTTTTNNTIIAILTRCKSSNVSCSRHKPEMRCLLSSKVSLRTTELKHSTTRYL